MATLHKNPVNDLKDTAWGGLLSLHTYMLHGKLNKSTKCLKLIRSATRMLDPIIPSQRQSFLYTDPTKLTMGFQVLTAQFLKFPVPWDITPRTLVKSYQNFQES